MNMGAQILFFTPFFSRQRFLSLRSRRLEVADERENGRARGRHARGEGAPARKAPAGASSPLARLLLARPFFLVPTTSKRLLRRLAFPPQEAQTIA